jgi:gamma-glutamylcyclotransferase (GGCT)/AIG2-like uncharacterized protein YtfP
VALYTAYASNMHPEQMVRRAPHSPLYGTGWLRGWRLTFGGEERGWDGALPTVVQGGPDQAVYVAIYDLTEADEKHLDEWEGVGIGLYRKVRVRVDTLEGQVVTWAYVLDDYEGGLPSAHYVGVLAEAAEAAGAPDDYVARLRRLPCRSVG